MSKVRTFSKVFPSYHPRRGEETFFVEKIWASVGRPHSNWCYPELMRHYHNFDNNTYTPKHHTVRAGQHFKAGDWFSPRVWSGKPYASKQIVIAPDIQVKKVWDFEINPMFTTGYCIGPKIVTFDKLGEIAKNDGLDRDDFECWFPKNLFKGQIICWNENIKYEPD